MKRAAIKGSPAALGISILLVATSAAAAPPSPADKLFERGKALYDAGKFEEACGALAESERLDPSVGTLGLLGACEEKRGRLASAYKDFVETERMARDRKDRRAEYAKERIEALKVRVPKLVIRLASPLDAPRISRNGEPVDAEEIGKEILVDPGEIEIVASGAGKGELRRKVAMTEGATVEVDVRLSAASEVSQPPPPPPTEHPAMRALSFVAGGIGLVGIGVGAYFGAHAISRNRASKDPATCPPMAAACEARDQAFHAATASSVSVGVGVAALGAGVALFVASRADAPRPSTGVVALRLSPALGAGLLGASLGGAF